MRQVRDPVPHGREAVGHRMQHAAGIGPDGELAAALALELLEGGLPDLPQARRLRHERRQPDADRIAVVGDLRDRSEEHTSELQSLMRISYDVFCLKKTKK